MHAILSSQSSPSYFSRCNSRNLAFFPLKLFHIIQRLHCNTTRGQRPFKGEGLGFRGSIIYLPTSGPWDGGGGGLRRRCLFKSKGGMSYFSLSL